MLLTEPEKDRASCWVATSDTVSSVEQAASIPAATAKNRYFFINETIKLIEKC
jgi:hypothetical protein